MVVFNCTQHKPLLIFLFPFERPLLLHCLLNYQLKYEFDDATYIPMKMHIHLYIYTQHNIYMEIYIFPNQSLCVGNVPQSFLYTRFLPHCVYYSDIIYLVLKCFCLLISKQSRNSRLLHKASFYNPQCYRKHLLF